MSVGDDWFPWDASSKRNLGRSLPSISSIILDGLYCVRCEYNITHKLRNGCATGPGAELTHPLILILRINRTYTLGGLPDPHLTQTCI